MPCFLQVSLSVAPVSPGVQSHGSRAGVSQRTQTEPRRSRETRKTRGVFRKPESELAAGSHLQETRQTQEAARDPQTGRGTQT